MLILGGARLIPRPWNNLWIGRGSMALNKLMFSTGFCGSSQWSEPHQCWRLSRKLSIETGGDSTVNISNALSLKNCLDRHDGIFRRVDGEIGKAVNISNAFSLKSSLDRHDDIFRRIDGEIRKARAVVPYCRLARDSELVLGEEVSANLVNGCGSSKHGRPLGFLDHPVPDKLVVAVDVDEVLGSFLSALNKFIADRYSLNHSLSEYYVYEFFKIWNCSRAEADIRVHEFFKTAYFKNGIHPIPGARHTLHKLSTFCRLSVVTSRQNAIKDHTLEWIEKHYPGLFQEIHFGNHFALDGQSRPKSEICRSLGAQVLIDDNPRYALECAEVGIRVLLFDYDNSYPWCKTGSATSHPLVTKVHNWQQVEQHLVSWAVL